jgi:pyruvate/2-oxoglutarate dehydrogenase complex dihydrolipoamide dehydrogenase (E3) component
MMAETFDAIVIGAGEAGTIIASRAVAAGHRVAMIYRPPFGSTCLNSGCVPSKFMIHRAHIAHLARTAGRFHVQVNEPTVDLAAIVAEKNADIEHHREESFGNARAADGLTLIEGTAKFVSDREVDAGGRSLHSERIFVATGMRPVVPKIAGLENVTFLTNESLMELTELPRHLIVVGGGYIGCELGQAFHRFGSRVTIIQKGKHLIAEEDPDVSTLLERAFTEEGIELLLNREVAAVENTHHGVRVTVRSKTGEEIAVTGSHLLISAGRVPNSDLDLARAGVQTDKKGFIRVDDSLQTNVPGIWAIGDINGQQPFTRICQEEGKIAFANAFENAGITIQRQYLGHAIFTDPQVGSVGLTLAQARERGIDAEGGLVMFDNVAKAKLIGETSGLMKYVFDRKSHHVLGCHVIGPAAAELIYTAILVMRHHGTIDEIARAVGIFPTLQEGMEGTARALLRKVAPEEVAGPLIVGSVHHEEPCFPVKKAA